MQLTPEQQRQLQNAKTVGERRVSLSLTDEQQRQWRDKVDQELADKDTNLMQFRKVKTASEQPGFFGDVRRAIFYSRRPLDELSAAIGVDVHTLSGFCAGEADLPSAALERLIGAFSLRLMQEIPR